MKFRTYLRIILNNIFINNLFTKVIMSVVNFYYNLLSFEEAILKFQNNVPLKYTDRKRNIFYLSITGDKVDCK